MCYVNHLATDCDQDLSTMVGNRLLLTQPEDEEAINLLQLPHRWNLTREWGGCGCSFRVSGILGSEPWFGPPEDWCPEDADDIEATQQFYDLVANLREEGHQVEVIAVWTGTGINEIKTLDVPLNKVSRDEFRFFENFLFRFV